jgi:hypothetical protein
VDGLGGMEGEHLRDEEKLNTWDQVARIRA